MSRKRPKMPVTRKQKKSVDNIISGKFDTKKEAMIDGGYAKTTAINPHKMMESRGVEAYLKQLSKKSQKLFKMEIEEKVMDVYFEGLEATRLYGKHAVEHPDHRVRLSFADRLAGFFGWISETRSMPGGQFNQFNFFSAPQKEQEKFNKGFKDFLTGYYAE